MDLYAGAVHCDVSNRTPVGNVELTYNGGFVNLTYNLNDGYVMSEAHVYVGCEEYPTKRRGRRTETTVAPGQYNFNPPGTLDYVSSYSVGPIEASGPIYVIVHAVVCEQVCRCSISVNDGGNYTPTGNNNSIDCNSENAEESNNGPGKPKGKFRTSLRASQGQNTKDLNINFELDIDSQVQVDILNLNGIILKSQVINDYRKGSDQTLNIDTSKIRDRVLFVRLTTNEGVEIKKIILNRK
jgi:hypothetical protein